jgi:hypothetical protein
MAYVGTTLYSSTLLTPAIDRIAHAVEDPFQSNASLDPFDDQIEISLTECIGHGASGQVFIGLTDSEKYAIKIASSKNGKQMLQQEAEIYEILSDLQGQCIPKIYGFFGSEHFKALVMAYMGHSVENISDLSIHQRCAVSSVQNFCLIIPWTVISYSKSCVSFTNTELCMQTFGLPTSFCRMDQLILLTFHMDINTNAQDARHALSLLMQVES